jgi:hypothetical protein
MDISIGLKAFIVVGANAVLMLRSAEFLLENPDFYAPM